MNISGIHGLPSAQNNYNVRKESARTQNSGKQDEVHISTDARQRYTVEDFIQRVKEYISELPEVRIGEVHSFQNELSNGYALNREQTSSIAEQLLVQFGL